MTTKLVDTPLSLSSCNHVKNPINFSFVTKYKYGVQSLIPTRKRAWVLWDGTRMSSLIKLTTMSFYTNQVEKAISLIWSQNGAYISHGLIHIHKIHHRLYLEGVITFLLVVYYVGFHMGYIKFFCSRFSSISSKLSSYVAHHFVKS